MDWLGPLSQLGLPGWLVSIAALIFILDKVGVVKSILESRADRREHRQALEREDHEARKRATETRELEVQKDKAEALAIARENIQWAREDFSIMQKTMEQQVRVLEQIREHIRILSSEVARQADGLKQTGRLKRDDD